MRLGLADAHPAYRIPGEVEFREPAGAAGPYVGIAAALDYPESEDAGLRKPQFVVLASAPLCPPQRPFDGLLHLPPFAGVGYALVQNHADVGAQIFLNSHARFGGDEELCAVEMRGERNPVLGDFAELRQAERLKSAAVRENRPLPAHELVEPPEARDELRGRAQVEVVGVCEYYLRSGFPDLERRQRLHRRLGADRHEHGRLHRSVGSQQFAAPRTGFSGDFF